MPHRPSSPGPARPATPPAPAEPASEEPIATSEQAEAIDQNYQFVDSAAAEDDVMLAVPAAPAESLAQIQHRPGARQRLLVKTRAMKQTFIPIMLTTGVFLLIGASLKFVMGKDSPVHDLPIWIPITVAALGLVLLAVAALNMLSVRTMLMAESGQTS